MISSNLQEKIREYGESLHVSQRGAFITASTIEERSTIASGLR
jgi:hypothetical protein